MTYSIAKLIEKRQGEQYLLHRRYINSSLARVQAIIGFDRLYTRGEDSYLWDVEGNRYLDLLSGHSVFNLGRAHPLVKQAMQEALAAIQLFLVRCGGDSHFCHSSHFSKVFGARSVALPCIFKVFYEHIGKRMNVAFWHIRGLPA